MKVLFYVQLFMILLTSPVFAAEIPQFDTKAYCKTVAEASGGSSTIELGCRDMEKDAKSALLKMSIPTKVLNYCTEVARVSSGSYSIFQGCVETEMDAQQKLDAQ